MTKVGEAEAACNVSALRDVECTVAATLPHTSASVMMGGMARIA